MEKLIVQTPEFLHQFFNHKGLLDRLYDLINKDDTAGLVMEVLACLKENGIMPPLVKHMKDKHMSAKYRNEGNNYYKGGKYQKVLECYNRALMEAPKGSDELVLAYSNRSALLFELKLFQACLNDIETCFSLGCPKNIVDRLNKRRAHANKVVWVEKMTNEARCNQFISQFFQLNEKRNGQIPCASADVGVIVKSQIPTVVALNEIKVGKVVAVEKMFTGMLDKTHLYNSCHHCQKMSPNLYPCETCCYALYCSEECRLLAQKEYHRIECQIIEILHQREFGINIRAVKAAIKLKNQFETWEELIEATSKLGVERMRASEINEIFDGNNKFSMLNARHDIIFYHGHVYNSSIGCTIVLNYLGHLKSFFPVDSDIRASAMRAFARLLMYFTINFLHVLTTSTMDVVGHNKTMFCCVGNVNIFPFVGKLRHACEPNVLALGLNNRVALVAVKPLKPGTELTVAYLGHWLFNKVDSLQRQWALLNFSQTVCDCLICTGDYKCLEETAKPTESQLRCLKKLNIEEMLRNFDLMKIDRVYPKCCQGLAAMADLPFSKEYLTVYTLFSKCLLQLQQYATGNKILDLSSIEDNENDGQVKI